MSSSSRKWERRVSLPNTNGGKLLCKPSTSYKKLLGRITFTCKDEKLNESCAKKMERNTYVTFYQRDIFFMRYFLRLRYFKKFPHNAEIRYWVIQEIRLLKSSHIEITLSVNGYALFVSLFSNVLLSQIRQQGKTASKCHIFCNLRKRFSSERKVSFLVC